MLLFFIKDRFFHPHSLFVPHHRSPHELGGGVLAVAARERFVLGPMAVDDVVDVDVELRGRVEPALQLEVLRPLLEGAAGSPDLFDQGTGVPKFYSTERQLAPACASGPAIRIAGVSPRSGAFRTARISPIVR